MNTTHIATSPSEIISLLASDFIRGFRALKNAELEVGGQKLQVYVSTHNSRGEGTVTLALHTGERPRQSKGCDVILGAFPAFNGYVRRTHQASFIATLEDQFLVSRKLDGVDFIIAVESGEITQEELEANAQGFVDSGVWRHLQGSWIRRVFDWHQQGLVSI